MFYAFCFLAFLQIILAIQSLRGGLAFRDYFRRELSRPTTNFVPPLTIFAPCRGLEEGLRENLSMLLRQNYPRYEVIFVVDSETDEAVPFIEELVEKAQTGARLVIAGKASDESQKVHNLRAAVHYAVSTSEVFVFVDSDARPSADWLSNLVAPLADETIGATSGYRWFIQKRGNFATYLQAVWNASIASALGANPHRNFCWGGATAIRRVTFERLQIAEKWRGTVSDDFVMTNALRAENLGIYFVPQCLTASVGDRSLRETLEFTTRQMKITRVYSPRHFKASFISSVIYALFWLNGFYLLALRDFAATRIVFVLLLMSAVFLLGALKSFIRLRTVEKVLPNYRTQLRKQTTAHLSLWSLTPFLFLYNNFCAILSRRIEWRGIIYQMNPERGTQVIRRKR